MERQKGHWKVNCASLTCEGKSSTVPITNLFYKIFLKVFPTEPQLILDSSTLDHSLHTRMTAKLQEVTNWIICCSPNELQILFLMSTIVSQQDLLKLKVSLFPSIPKDA